MIATPLPEIAGFLEYFREVHLAPFLHLKNVICNLFSVDTTFAILGTAAEL